MPICRKQQAIILLFGILLLKTGFSALPPEENFDLTEVRTFSSDLYDEFQIAHFAKERIEELNSQGFLNARKDSITIDNSQYRVYIFKGQPFFFQLTAGNLGETVIRQLNLGNAFSGNYIPYMEYEKIIRKILQYYSNTGYPFARISNRDINIHDNNIYATLDLQLLEFITFDEIKIDGDINLSRHFLENYLGIKNGAPYSEVAVTRAGEKIKDLDFVVLERPAELSFSQQQAKLVLPLKKRQSNRFDGIVGFVSSDDPQVVLQLTGSLDLHLVNSLGFGEFFNLAWQGIGQGTQILNLKGGYPYPLGMPVRFDGQFSLHKQDTTWIRIMQRPNFEFLPSAFFSIGVFIHLEQNNLLAVSQYREQSSPPGNLDFRTRLYGLSFGYRTPGYDTDLIQKGLKAFMSLSAGQRTIIENNNLPQFFYDDLELRQTQWVLSFVLEKRWRLANNITLGLESDNFFNPGVDLLENQLSRVGGFRSVKGFDELSLLASSFSFGNAEIRFFTSEKTYFSGFINGGWYERKVRAGYFNDFPVGFGGGLNLETQAGIFAIYAAMGKQRDIPFQVRNSKIHIGYTSIF
jgi:hypothetical protein